MKVVQASPCFILEIQYLSSEGRRIVIYIVVINIGVSNYSRGYEYIFRDGWNDTIFKGGRDSSPTLLICHFQRCCFWWRLGRWDLAEASIEVVVSSTVVAQKTFTLALNSALWNNILWFIQ